MSTPKVFIYTFYTFIIINISFLLLSTIQGCVDAPNQVGADILSSTDLPELRKDTLYARTHETRFFISSNYTLDRFCIGKYQTYESWGILSFLDLPDSLKNIRVLSAKIRLKAMYRFGDSASILSFRAYRLLSDWTGDSLTYDSLTQRPSHYYDATTPLQLYFSQAIGDTDYVYIQIPDTAIVRQWFATIGDSIEYNYGLLFEPTNNSVILGFSTFYSLDTAAMPTLFVEYEKDGIQDTYIHQYSSSRFLPTANYSAIVSSSSLFYVQNGIPYRGILTFNVDNIPNPSVINSAYLYLTASNAQTLRNIYSRDSLIVTQLNSDGTMTYPWVAISTTTIDSLGNRTYKFDIKFAVNSWIRRRYPSQIIVMGYSENSTFDRTALYGVSASNALYIPRIEVSYSTR